MGILIAFKVLQNGNRTEKMEGFSFVTPITGLNRPNTGKDDDDDVCFFCNPSKWILLFS
jgi:hypothetical protein